MSHQSNRRTFLGQGLAGISLAATAPSFLALSSSALAADEASGNAKSDRILVVLQLSGGNDGLSDGQCDRCRQSASVAQRADLTHDDR